MNEDEFDSYLARRLDDAGLPEDDFVAAVTARIRRHQRRRRWALVGAATISSAAAAIGVLLSPAPVVAMPDGTPAGLLAGLLLAAACSLVWIGAESRTPL